MTTKKNDVRSDSVARSLERSRRHLKRAMELREPTRRALAEAQREIERLKQASAR